MTNHEIVERLKRAIRRGGSSVTDELLDAIDERLNREQIDLDKAKWDTVVQMANAALLRWICTNNRRLKKMVDIDGARDALCIPDRKADIIYWIEDIDDLYLPRALEIYLKLEKI